MLETSQSQGDRLQSDAKHVQGMGDLLEKALQESSPQQKTQLQYVLHQLNQDIDQEIQDSENEDQEDDDEEVWKRKL